jgi:Regulator of ribonuclease activity B
MTEIRHWSYFPSAESQHRFMYVAELGYHVDHTHEEGSEPTRFCVCFSKVQNVDDLEQIWQQLSGLSAGCDGEYDGHEFCIDDEAEPRFSLN